jgi:alkaline phosphatase D
MGARGAPLLGISAAGRRRLLLAGAAVALAPACSSVAGPALAPDALAAQVPRFELGVASGQPQPQAVVLWTRLTGPALPPQVSVVWELAADPGFTRIVARGVEVALAADAHCVHAEPQGLRPARPYWYRFQALGQRSAVGRTRTAPAPEDAVSRFQYAIASCQRWDTGRYAAWRDVAAQAQAEGLDAVLFLGDYIYEYPSAPSAVRPVQGGLVRTLDDYRRRYAQYKTDPALQAAHAACPWLVVWDDHEVDNDYAKLQGQTLQPDFAQQRAAAYRAWWEHMPVAKSMRPVGPDLRIYTRLDWGRLARLHLLDDRQYRDPQACPRPGRAGSNTVRLADCAALAQPQRTLLGAAQEHWLAEGWALDRPWNLLAQQTLLSRLNWESPTAVGASMEPGRESGRQSGRDGDRDSGRYWTDGWDGYPAARQRLLNVVQQRQVPGVVILGGDVHANCVANVLADFNDPKSTVLASEFCGTSISSPGRPQDRLDAALPHNPHIRWGRADQRGYVLFDLRPGELRAELRVVADIDRADSTVTTAARFAVAADQPGVWPG